MKPTAFQWLPDDPDNALSEPLPPGPLDPLLAERLERILSGLEPPPIMKHPPEVLDMLERQMQLTPFITPETQRRLLDDWSLSYYHGGDEVLTWESPQGRAVLAVGMENVARARHHLSDEGCLEVIGQYPPLW